MALSNKDLDRIVVDWKQYAEESPGRLQPSRVIKRDGNMYRGMGTVGADELALRLVQDYSVASLEMTMGYLYERVLEALGPQKLSNQRKRQPGFRGIDFVQTTPSEVRLINLKASTSTSNADIAGATLRNLEAAREHWSAHPATDDNPLGKGKKDISVIRAVARGPAKSATLPQGGLWLVGAATWEYFGAGANLLARLSDALGRNPLDNSRFKAELQRAADRVLAYLSQGGFVGSAGVIYWHKLIER